MLEEKPKQNCLNGLFSSFGKICFRSQNLVMVNLVLTLGVEIGNLLYRYWEFFKANQNFENGKIL